MAKGLTTITAERATEVMELNKAGEHPAVLDDSEREAPVRPVDLAEQEELTRFDRTKKRKKKSRNKHKNSDDRKGGDDHKTSEGKKNHEQA